MQHWNSRYSELTLKTRLLARSPSKQGRLLLRQCSAYVLKMPLRHPPPWTIVRTPGGWRVIDANGNAPAYVYGQQDSSAAAPDRRGSAAHCRQHRPAAGSGAPANYRRLRWDIRHVTVLQPVLGVPEATQLGHYHFAQPAVCGAVASRIMPDRVNRHRHRRAIDFDVRPLSTVGGPASSQSAAPRRPRSRLAALHTDS